MLRYRICACSVTRPGTLLVQDEDGNCSVYFTRTASLSVTTLDPAFTDAMVQCDDWCRVDAEAWLSLDELQHHAVDTTFIRPHDSFQPEL